MSLGSMNISGLASGLDVSSIIEQLMSIERQPYNRMELQLEKLELKKSMIQEVNTKAFELQTLVFDLTLENTYRQASVLSSDQAVASASAQGYVTGGIEHELAVTKLAQAHSVAGEKLAPGTGISDPLGFTGGTFSINGTQFTVADGYTLTGIRDMINSNKEAGVKASIVDSTLVITANETGAAGQISFSDDAGTVLQDLSIIDGGGAVLKEIRAAQDAELTIDGLSVTSASNTLDGVVSGLSIQLKGTGTTTISTEQNVDGLVEKVKTLVEKYNEMLNMLADKIGETKLSDTVINSAEDEETREELLGIGLLRGDYTLIAMQNDLREAFSGIVGSLSMEDVGLKTTGMVGGSMTEDAKRGIIVLDEEMLREKLAADTEKVISLFRNTGGSTTVSDELVGSGSGADVRFMLDYQNVAEQVAVTVNGVAFKEVSEFTTGISEFKLNHNTGEIIFGAAPAVGEDIKASYQYLEGATLASDGDYEFGTGTGYNSTFFIGNQYVRDGVSVKVGGVSYKEVTSLDDLDADDEYYLDHDRGRITFFKPPDNGADLTATYDYMIIGQGTMWQLNNVLKEVSGIGSLYDDERSADNEISDVQARMAQLEDRLTSKEELLWKQWTALETALSSTQSQATWLSSQLEKLS
ncbi:MAG: flagellar filament capping protein FliD [Candidatus Wallbacteria bacterium]|nr:flagellar filament capping protein FliD [Candidatus Wallbacteria bacterium]